jgi:hypothetical protein
VVGATNGVKFLLPGIYAVSVAGSIGAAATGRTFVGLQTPAGAVITRSGTPVGEDVIYTTMPNLRITAANTTIILAVFQTSGAARTVTSRVRVTKVG